MDKIEISVYYSVVENEILKTPRVIEAMKKVDRANFCKFNPYNDSPQTIGYSVTISAPHMVIMILKNLI